MIIKTIIIRKREEQNYELIGRQDVRRIPRTEGGFVCVCDALDWSIIMCLFSRSLVCERTTTNGSHAARIRLLRAHDKPPRRDLDFRWSFRMPIYTVPICTIFVMEQTIVERL